MDGVFVKIAIIGSVPYPPACGIGRYICSLSSKLIQRGNEVTFITRGSVRQSFETAEGMNVRRLPFLKIYPFHVDIHGLFINQFLKNSDFDVIHVHEPLSPIVNTCTPKVTTFHTPFFSDSLLTGSGDFRGFLTKCLGIFDYRIEKQQITSSAVLTAVSLGVKQDLERFYPIKSRFVSVLGNAPDDKFIEAGSNPRISKKDNFLILYIGRLDYRKGLLDLIESFKLVTAKVPEARLIIIGKGPLLPHMVKRIKELKLSKKIEIRGFVKDEEIMQYYLLASIFVLPSYYEGMATTCLEAMACQTSVIATNVRGNAEIVKDEKTGLLVADHNPQQLSDAIIRLLKNPDLRETLAKNGRMLIEQKYTWNKIADRVLNTYYAALGN